MKFKLFITSLFLLVFVTDFYFQEDDENCPVGKYILSKNFSLMASYDSCFDTGGGLTIRF